MSEEWVFGGEVMWGEMGVSRMRVMVHADRERVLECRGGEKGWD